jgi:hypothetical protein
MHENQQDIWKDNKTGLPIHTHNLRGSGLEFDPFPCKCGNSAYDYPLSAVPEGQRDLHLDYDPLLQPGRGLTQ